MEDWAKMRDDWMKGFMKKGEREMPKVACGYCKYYLQNSLSASSDGWCTVQKIEGGGNKVVFAHDDASNCSMFSEMERIRTDASELMWDPHVRTQRQFREK
jgi:hypothetical protein